MLAPELSTYHAELNQKVRLEAEESETVESLSHAFTSYAMDLLLDAGEASDPLSALYSVGKMHTSGMDWEAERGLLTIYGTDYGALLDVQSLTKAELGPVLKRMREFTVNASLDLASKIDESSQLHDLVLQIEGVWPSVQRIRFVVLTNSVLKTQVPAVEAVRDIEAYVDVWDLDRLHKLASSGRASEPVTVEFGEFGYSGLPVLGPNGLSNEYDSYLGVIPGDVLAAVYSAYGPRLLELNVRSFLQTRGKINKGIQETIKNAPARFLAYNNGLSMTASSVETSIQDGGTRITKLEDLQIVNGGQTTASLYHASSVGGLDLSSIGVQVKLTVVAPDVREELAPRISEYSNSQNPVRMADFSANDPFHVALEQHSRAVWAPGPNGTSQMSRWFFERARGQYADALARQRTPAAQRSFKLENPNSQKLLKTDIAKYENTWAQFPHLVSLGAEKNFREFLQARRENSMSIVPDEDYFKRLVAKAILWRRTEKIVTDLRLGAYRAATVAYTLALLSNRTAQRIDLDAIWKRQDLPEDLSDAVRSLAPLVYESITSTAGTRNVTEWAKKKECWAAVQTVVWQVPSSLQLGAVKPTGSRGTAHAPDSAAPKSDAEADAVAMIEKMLGQTWIELAVWAKETNNLAPWQRSLSFSIGRILSGGRSPSVKQAVQGQKIYAEAERLGFAPSQPDGI